MSNYVREGSRVKLFDYKSKSEVMFEVVAQTQKTHYIGGSRGGGTYHIRSIKVLDTGGNGVNSISLKSMLGQAISGKTEGSVVSYKNGDGELEKFKILKVVNNGDSTTKARRQIEKNKSYRVANKTSNNKVKLFDSRLVAYTFATTGLISETKKRYPDSLLIWIVGKPTKSATLGKYDFLLEYKGHKKRVSGESNAQSEKGAIIHGLEKAVECIVKPCTVVIISTKKLSFNRACLGAGSYSSELSNILKKLHKKDCSLIENHYVGSKVAFDYYIALQDI